MNQHSSLAGRLMATAAGIAFVAVAIGFAVHLILSIWVPLVVIVGIALLLFGAVTWGSSPREVDTRLIGYAAG